LEYNNFLEKYIMNTNPNWPSKTSKPSGPGRGNKVLKGKWDIIN